MQRPKADYDYDYEREREHERETEPNRPKRPPSRAVAHSAFGINSGLGQRALR